MIRIATAAVIALAFSPVASATDSYVQRQKITPSLDGDTAPGDRFGDAVDIDGDFMVAASAQDDDVGTRAFLDSLSQNNSGSATIFRRGASPNEWDLVKKLLPEEGSELYGWRVSISGDSIAVSALTDGDQAARAGTVYLYDRNQGGVDNWGLVKVIFSAERATSDQFGYDIDLQGDRLLVGAPKHDALATSSGAAFIFERNQGGANNWGELRQLLPSTTGEDLLGGEFGSSVALDGDAAAVGAHRDDRAGSNAGAVYIFEKDLGGTDAWGEKVKLDAGDEASSSASLGHSVDLSDGLLAVGALNEDAGYLFEQDSTSGDWSKIKRLESAFPGGESRYGQDVAIAGDRVFFGDDLSPPDRNGTVYIYGQAIDDGSGGDWGLITNLYATDRVRGMDFGKSLAVDSGVLVAGAPEDDDFGSRSGSSFFFVQDEGGADNWGVVAEVNPGESGAEGIFGQSVAVSGNTLFVGAPEDRVTGIESGSVAVYQLSAGSWEPLTLLSPSDYDTRDSFGFNLDAAGPYVLAASNPNDTRRGAHLFSRDQGEPNGWGEVKFLDIERGSNGPAVTIDGDTAVVADWSTATTPAGTAFIFSKDQGGTDNWGLVTNVVPSDGMASDRFGWSVDLKGDALIVGARNHDEAANDAGAAYIFRRDEGGINAWGEVEKLLPSNPENSQSFGESVAIFGATAAVGAPDTGSRQGSVFIFSDDGTEWNEVRVLPADVRGNDESFGNTISLWSDLLVVSAGGWHDPTLSPSRNFAGAAFVFQRDEGGVNNWGEVARLQQTDKIQSDQFTGLRNSAYPISRTVQIDCNVIVGGAPVKDTQNADVGAAYVFASDALFCGDFEP